MNFRRHKRGSEISPLQSAPLLSVILLLLCLQVGGVTFMPAPHEEVAVHLPVVGDGQPVEHRAGELVVEIAASGTLQVNHGSLTMDELRARLQQLSRDVAESVVLVRADPDTPLAKVIAVVEACRIAEIDRYSVMAIVGRPGVPATGRP